MAGARFLNAQTCPWTQGLYTSRLSSTPGARGFRMGVVLLLDWLPTKAGEPSLPKDVWLFRTSRFPQILRPIYVARTPRQPATRQFIRNVTYNFCRKVACQYFGAYGTRTRVVHLSGFWGWSRILRSMCVARITRRLGQTTLYPVVN